MPRMSTCASGSCSHNASMSTKFLAVETIGVVSESDERDQGSKAMRRVEAESAERAVKTMERARIMRKLREEAPLPHPRPATEAPDRPCRCPSCACSTYLQICSEDPCSACSLGAVISTVARGFAIAPTLLKAHWKVCPSPIMASMTMRGNASLQLAENSLQATWTSSLHFAVWIYAATPSWPCLLQTYA